MQDPSIGINPAQIGVVGLLILLVIDKVAFWFHKIGDNKNGRSNVCRPCKDDPEMIKAFENAARSGIAHDKMNEGINKLVVQAQIQTEFLKTIAKNGGGK